MEESTKTVIEDGKMEPVGDYKGPEDLYQDLIRRVKKYHPSDNISLIEKAYNLANEKIFRTDSGRRICREMFDFPLE